MSQSKNPDKRPNLYNPGPYYETPSFYEVKLGLRAQTRKGDKDDLEKIDLGLTQDFANRYSEGDKRPFAEVERDLKENAKTYFAPRMIDKKTFNLKDPKYRMPDGSTAENFTQCLQAHQEGDLRYLEKAGDFLDHLNLKDVPGNSPLAKAFALWKILGDTDQGQGEEGQPNNGNDQGENHQKSKAIDQAQSGKQLANKVNKVTEAVKNLSKEDLDALDQLNDDNNKDGDSESPPGNNPGGDSLDRRIRAARSLFENINWIDIVKFANILDTKFKIKTDLSDKYVEDEDGHIIREHPIEDFSQIGLLDGIDYMDSPDVMGMKVMEGDYDIPVRYSPEKKKSVVAHIVDRSGSMSSGSKSKRALAIIWSMIMRVNRNECDMIFSFFERRCDYILLVTKEGVYEIKGGKKQRKKYKTATEFYKKECLTQDFSGGTTDVAGSVSVVLKNLEEYIEVETTNQSSISKEDKIVVVTNDGQDNVDSLKVDTLKGGKLYVFSLEQPNDRLEQIAVETGGQFSTQLE